MILTVKCRWSDGVLFIFCSLRTTNLFIRHNRIRCACVCVLAEKLWDSKQLLQCCWVSAEQWFKNGGKQTFPINTRKCNRMKGTTATTTSPNINGILVVDPFANTIQSQVTCDNFNWQHTFTLWCSNAVWCSLHPCVRAYVCECEAYLLRCSSRQCFSIAFYSSYLSHFTVTRQCVSYSIWIRERIARGGRQDHEKYETT